MVQFYLEGDRIPEFVAHLMKQKPVYTPHRKGQKSFSFERTENAEDVVLDYARTMHSIKKFFLPPKEDLLHFDLAANDKVLDMRRVDDWQTQGDDRVWLLTIDFNCTIHLAAGV